MNNKDPKQPRAVRKANKEWVYSTWALILFYVGSWFVVAIVVAAITTLINIIL